MICKNRPLTILIWSILFSSGCARRPPPPELTPTFRAIQVIAVEVEPQHVSASSHRAASPAFVRLLKEAATVEVMKTLFQQKVGEYVNRSVEPEAGPDALVIETSLNMPTSLSPDILGLVAANQKGSFATARMTAKRGPQVLGSVVESISWSEVRWTTGTNRSRRRRRVEDVLLDGAIEVVKKAVFTMQRKVSRDIE